MITLCFRSVLEHQTRDVMVFKPDFLAWCADFANYEMSVVSKDHNPGYQVDLTYDFEVKGLTDDEEALWLLRCWGESDRKHPEILPRDTDYRASLASPYAQYLFTVEVAL